MQRRLPLVSQTTEYAFRALAELAREPEVPMRAAELSARTGVPVAYLSKVLRRLVAGGVLRGQKGHGGGFVMRRPPDKTSFSDVLAALGEAPAKDRCAFGWGSCDAAHPCPLHPAWSRLQDAFGRWASATKLDMIAASAVQPKRARRRQARGKRGRAAR